MMATVPHVTSDLGFRKFQADVFLLTQCTYLQLQDVVSEFFKLSWASDKPSAVHFVTGMWEDVKIDIQIAECRMRLNYIAALYWTGWLITAVCQFCGSGCVCVVLIAVLFA